MHEIRSQVKELREYAEYLDWVGAEKVMKALITQAADTIEALSEKLAVENTERSERCYGKEKELIEELAEEIENCYGRETELSERARDYLLKTDYGGGWIACEDRLPEELRHCLEGDGCGDCAYHEPETKLTCRGLLQKAYEAVNGYEEMFPCKVGDIVYIVSRGRILPIEVLEIQIFLLKKELVTQIKCNDGVFYGYMHFLTKEIGKTVFLTKEAAEKALKEMEDRKNEETDFCR